MNMLKSMIYMLFDMTGIIHERKFTLKIEKLFSEHRQRITSCDYNAETVQKKQKILLVYYT